jgi:hypothetical protein
MASGLHNVMEVDEIKVMNPDTDIEKVGSDNLATDLLQNISC